MDGLRAWGAAVCMAALGCSAVRLLAPNSGTGKLLRLLVTTVFIVCLLTPLSGLRSLTSLDLDGLPEEVTADLLEEAVTRQLQIQVQEAVTTIAEEGLAARGVTAKKITVLTDTSEEGGIYIQQVIIAVDKQTVAIAKTVGEVLTEQLQATVTVEAW